MTHLHPGTEVLVEVPWGDPTTLVRARVVAVSTSDSRPGGFAPRPIAVEWIEAPPFPGGRYPAVSTFDPDKVRPLGQRRGRKGMVTLELFA